MLDAVPGLETAYWLIIGLTAVGSLIVFGYAVWFGVFVLSQRQRRAPR